MRNCYLHVTMETHLVVAMVVCLCMITSTVAGDCDNKEELAATVESSPHLAVAYGNAKLAYCAIVDRQKAEKSPSVTIPKGTDGDYFTLVMADPDAPRRNDATNYYWLHWLVEDISKSDLSQGNVQGNVLVEYAGPSPPSGTGYHRYQIFVFKQSTQNAGLPTYKSRAKFDLPAFIKEHDLCDSLVGAFQFQAQHSK